MGGTFDMTAIQQFIAAVNDSRVLSYDQKKELTDNPGILPEAYRTQIIAMLTTFDEHSKIREEALRSRLTASFIEFEKEIAVSSMDEDEKARVLQKAREQIKEFFPQPSEV